MNSKIINFNEISKFKINTSIVEHALVFNREDAAVTTRKYAASPSSKSAKTKPAKKSWLIILWTSLLTFLNLIKIDEPSNKYGCDYGYSGKHCDGI
jgi:hypothetical protein